MLAYLRQEPGSSAVREAISDSSMSAANWSEVLQKSAQHGRDPVRVGGLLQARGIKVEPATIADAETGASLWSQRPSLSLADRLCLALARRLDCEVLTADNASAGMPGVRLIR